MPNELGSSLLSANPVSQNGRGAAAVEQAAKLLAARLGEGKLEVSLTEHPRHAVEIAAGAAGFDTVVALGGDGLIHEVAGGLMTLDEGVRPTLGLIPVGSGNDYAVSLGVSSKPERAIDQLFEAQELLADVGVCNGEYFVETASFGLDAAIAIDTVERRKRTGRSGALLYFSSGVDQMLHHLDQHSYRMTLDGKRELSGQMYLFAIQNGRTYGGGFKVCPQASLDDGAFDLCIAHPPLNAASATFIFVLAKEGFHRRFKQIEFAKARHVRVEFDGPVPAQVDGERIEGASFEVSMIPRALRVLAPSGHAFADAKRDGYVRVS